MSSAIDSISTNINIYIPAKIMNKRKNIYLYLAIAFLALFSGYLVYFVGRPGAAIYAIPAALETWVNVIPVFVEFSGPLPGFFHTYAFILLTFVVLGIYSRAYLYVSIAVWVCLEAVFEFAQHPMLNNAIASFVPTWFENIPLLELTESYFLLGTFHPMDLVAIFLAAIAVLLTVRAISGKDFYHD